MLYEQWLKIVRANGSELALWDFGAGRRWTFAELAREAESAALRQPVAHPSGSSAQFILDSLAAWREKKLLCPLEHGQIAPALDGAPEEICHAKITSGSTGKPRAVLFKAGQLAADARQIVSTMGLRPDWPNLGVISLAHSYGFSNLVLPLLLCGIPLILASAPFPEIIRAATREAGSVTLPGVPALWKMWSDSGVINPAIKLAISAGAPLPLALEQEIFASHGLKVHNFYGSSECGGIAYDRSALPRTDSSCAGQPMDGVNLSLSAEGAVIVQSAAAGEAYWPDASDQLSGGFFRSTDLAEIRNGEVYLKGRGTDLINVAGRKVAPETVENAIRSHPAIIHAVVFGIPSRNQGRGEEIVACVNPGLSPLTIPELQRFLSRELPSWQIPKAWWFAQNLIPDVRGKLSRADWKRKFLQSQSRQ
jgi:acyl-coenzyme A synthetase/AMP-(fatty) acid ligase